MISLCLCASVFSSSSHPPVLPLRLEAGTGFHGVQVVVPYNQRTREKASQLPQEGNERCLLCRCAGIGGLACGIQSPFIADAYGMPVVMKAMCTCFLQRTTAVNLAVAGQVEVVADVAEAAVPDVVTAAVLKAQAHALRRGRAMYNKQGNRAHDYLQAPRPKAPAMAVATVMITLRTIPHTDFLDSFSSFITSITKH